MSVAKKKLLTRLGRARDSCTKTIKEANEIQDFNGLSDAFPKTRERLPLLGRVLELFIASLSSSNDGEKQEQQEEVEKAYPDTLEFAETCRDEVETIQELFQSVADSTETAAARYASYGEAAATQESDEPGRMIEAILRHLLQQVIDLEVFPLLIDEGEEVEETLGKSLEEAIEELSKVKPSLKGGPPGAAKGGGGGGVHLVNHGSGTQFFHNGKGNMNHCADGGRQVNGGEGHTINWH